MNNISPDGVMDWSRVVRVPAEPAAAKRFLLRPGDVLFNNTNSQELVGKTALFAGYSEPITFSNHFTRLRAGPDLEPGFLALWLHRLWQSGFFFRGSTRWVGQAAFGTTQLLQLEIPLPGLAEQLRLSQAAMAELETIRRLSAASANIQVPSRSLRQRLLSAPFLSEGGPPIGAVATIQTGYAFRSEWFRASGVRLLRNANIGHRQIDWSDCVYLDPTMGANFESFGLHVGDVVLSLDRPIISTGLKVARLTESDVPSLLLQRVARLLPSPSVDPDYLFAFLLSARFEAEISGHDQSIGIPHISPAQVARITIPLPGIDEQRLIVLGLLERLAAIDELDQSIRTEREAIDAMPAAVLRRAFAQMGT